MDVATEGRVSLKVKASPARYRAPLWFWAGAILFILGGLAFGYYWLASSRISWRISVQGTPLGGMSPQEAASVLAARLESYKATPIPLVSGPQRWEALPQELGFSYDVQETVAQVYAVGKEGEPWEQLGERLVTLILGREVPLVFTIDAKAQGKVLSQLSQALDQPPHNATLSVTSDYKVTIVPSREGHGLLIPQAQELLAQRLAALSTEPIELPLGTLYPTLTEADLSADRARVEQMLAGPMALTYTLDGGATRTWEFTPKTLAALMRFGDAVNEQGVTKFKLSLLDDRVRALGQRIAAVVERDPQDARFEVRGAQVVRIQASQDGLRIDYDRLPSALLAAAQGSNRTAPLPLMVTKPKIVESFPSMGIVEKIEERRTYYGGSVSPRKKNVELGVKRLHGVVVPPGETFSFGEAVGEISDKTGYYMGLSIIGDQTVPDFGGGICQVSTTVFRTAFWAGYPIEERWAHSYRLRGYYETTPDGIPGLDATVYPPAVDLKFKNDTATPILIQARTDGSWIYVSFYGTSPQRKVEIDGPYLTNFKAPDDKLVVKKTPLYDKGVEVWVEGPNPEPGVDVTLTRRVMSKAGELLSQQTFFSRYRPMGRVKLIGTGGEPVEEETPTPTPTPTR